MNFILDVERSAEIAKLVRPQKHQCYLNSFRALSNLPVGTRYVEGFAVMKSIGVPLEHGWCLLPDDKTVVDVTWFDKPPVKYYPVVSYSLKEILDKVTEPEEDQSLPTKWYRIDGAQDRVLAIFRECQNIIWE